MADVVPEAPLFAGDDLELDRITFQRVARVRTRLWESGQGEPLVLVHGGEFGDVYSLDSWSLNLNELSNTFHVFAFDRLGQGFTDNPPTQYGYTIDAVLEHVTAFLEDIPPSPAHLVGHSRGGFLVMRLAVERPDLVRTVTIVDSNTAAPENPEVPSDRFYKALEQRVPGPPIPDDVHIEPELQSYETAHITDHFLNRMREIAALPKLRDAYLGRQPQLREKWEEGLNRKRHETLDLLAESGIQVPVLVVWGRDDPSAPLSLGIDLFDRICEHTEWAQLHVINHAGHYLFREHPKTFNTLLRAFCSQN